MDWALKLGFSTLPTIQNLPLHFDLGRDVICISNLSARMSWPVRWPRVAIPFIIINKICVPAVCWNSAPLNQELSWMCLLLSEAETVMSLSRLFFPTYHDIARGWLTRIVRWEKTCLAFLWSLTDTGLETLQFGALRSSTQGTKRRVYASTPEMRSFPCKAIVNFIEMWRCTVLDEGEIEVEIEE
jgi:hypothetical protein